MNIGVFDSGVGGLWILKHLKDALPHNNYVFFGDQGHVPYGKRSMDQIRNLSEAISKFLIEKDCRIIVIACNTASAASLKYLREKYPDTIFVGMEPAVKPAVETTHTGKVGVLATPATFQGELYNSVVERFASGVEIFQNTCDGLVNQIEKGELDTDKTKSILRDAILPMIDKGIDTIVLGCTHYPFVIPQIREIVGDDVNIIDPTNSIVRRVSNLLEDKGLVEESTDNGTVEVFTSGELLYMKPVIYKLFGEDININRVGWKDDLTLNMLK